MNKKRYIKKISDYTIVGGLGTLLLTFTGCGEKPQEESHSLSKDSASSSQANVKENAFVIIEQKPDGSYKIVDEYPSKDMRIILRESDGTERILSKDEIDRFVKEESDKIDNGTSNLTKPADEGSVSNGGMGLGEVLLSSIAGAMIGSYIGNKLFGNSNYQNNRANNYNNRSTYSRSNGSFNNRSTSTSRSTTTNKKSGFFGKTNNNTSSTSTTTSKLGG
jgi:hypothetical protein